MERRGRHSGETHPGTNLRRIDWTTELTAVRPLFVQYRDWIAEHRDPSPSAQARVEEGLGEIDRLVAGLPGTYGPPAGDVILALSKGTVVACGALRELEPGAGEIKRIYVRADHRGPGFGPRLTQALLDRARELGYEHIRVDTLPSMTAAIEFYEEMGFIPVPAFWSHPVEGARFFEIDLRGR
jgi:putative acetyltransferase